MKQKTYRQEVVGIYYGHRKSDGSEYTVISYLVDIDERYGIGKEAKTAYIGKRVTGVKVGDCVMFNTVARGSHVYIDDAIPVKIKN